MDPHNSTDYKPGAERNEGVIALDGAGEYRHTFGGCRWSVIQTEPLCCDPALLITLDLSDPLLTPLQLPGFTELPLASHVNCGLWVERQIYRLDPVNRSIELVTNESAPACPDPRHMFPVPWPERSLRLTPMTPQDLPETQDDLERIADHVLSTDRYIRILGPPIWMFDPLVETCTCGRLMKYIASIGQESRRVYERRGGVGSRFFIGEGVLYFFLCIRCFTISVRMQST
jgi:hypothetical protein